MVHNVGDLFRQIGPNVFFAIFYTIFLILFYRLTPRSVIDGYAFILLPITLIISMISLFKGFNSTYSSSFNVLFERIKLILLLFCFVTSIIVYYVMDPGGLISRYFGSSLLVTLLLTTFAFLFAIVMLTMPETEAFASSKTSSFFTNFSGKTITACIAFVVFLLILVIVMATYPGGFFNETNKVGSTVIMLVSACLFVIGALLIGSLAFPGIFENRGTSTNKPMLVKQSLLFLFGIILSGLFILWLVLTLQSLSGQTDVLSFMLNVGIVIFAMALLYRTIYVKIPHQDNANVKKTEFFDLLFKLFFYIPCMFLNVYDAIKAHKTTDNVTTKTHVIILVATIAAILLYWFLPSLLNLIYLQGGKLLLNDPVNTNVEYSLGTYEELNGPGAFDYHFAVSCWVFVNANAPNTNVSYTKYTSLLNFGGKPNILYNASTNTLMITMQQKDLPKAIANNKQTLVEFDEDGNRILFKQSNWLLQKWNNIIVNFNGGVLDVFLNGELLKTDIGVVSYYTLDKLTIGENEGVNGGMCNVVYFNKALTAAKIFVIYNSLKNKRIPTTEQTSKTRVEENMKR